MAMQKNKAPGWQAEGYEEKKELSTATVAHLATEAQLVADLDKASATLRARLALRGWALSRTYCADHPVVFFATRWNMPRDLAILEDVAAFADRVGA